MALYRVYQMVPPAKTAEKRAVNRRNAILVIIVFFFVIGIPLTASSLRIAGDAQKEAEVRQITEDWADSVGWEVMEVTPSTSRVRVRVIGSPPIPETASYAAALEAAGFDTSNVVVEFIPQTVVALGGTVVPD